MTISDAPIVPMPAASDNTPLLPLEPARPAGAYLSEHTEEPATRRRSVVGDLREIVEEMRHCGDLVQQLTLRDIRIRYKQALLGFAWALLIPAAVVLAGMAVRVAIAYASGRRHWTTTISPAWQ